jgi:hypothetical protein
MNKLLSPKKGPKMRYCFNCGDALGQYVDYDALDTCGKNECNREARNANAENRQNAHDELDRNMGW